MCENQTGAVCFYTPEKGVSLEQLRKDVEFLKLRYSLDVKGKAEGRLILRSAAGHNSSSLFPFLSSCALHFTLK